MTALKRLAHFEQWRARLPARQSLAEFERTMSVEAIARRRLAAERAAMPRRPLLISRDDIEKSAAEQRCIASLERVNAAVARRSQANGG